MAGIRDLWIGRLGLVTYDDSFQEAIGDELVLSGGVAALGARKPKRYAFTLPLHGTNLDGNPYASAQRMRRQVRSLTENTVARSQGFYMRAWLDPEQNGWLMMGSGTIQYANGGVTLGEYSLVMDEIYRVASARTYRSGRRFDWYDRRLSTTSRDYLGSRYSTDFANLTGGVYALSAAFAWLPPGCVDVVGLGRQYLNTYPVFSQEGMILAVQGQSYGAVVNYEQPETQRHASDVVIWDRQGQGDWTPPYTNLVPNPSFENDATGAAPAGYVQYNPQSQTFNTFAVQTGWAASGGKSLRLTVSSFAAAAYVGLESVVIGGLTAGQAYSFSVVVDALSVGVGVVGLVQVLWQNAGGGTISATTSGDFSLSGVSVLTISGTAPASTAQARVLVQFANRGGAASNIDAYIDALQLTATTAPVNYFDGSTPGYAWTGAAHNSTSQGPFGWRNPLRNASAKSGATNWGVGGSGGTLASTLTNVADAAFSPYNAFDVALSGVTSSFLVAGSTLATDAMSVAPGQTVYVEGWVKLLNALPAGATLGVSAQWANAGGANQSTTSVGSIGSTANVGQWYRLSGTVTVPAGIALATITVLTAGHAITTAIHYRADNLLITDTMLGLPPVYNPPNFPNARYFDGDSQRAGWLGNWSNSPSVLWLDPQDQPGWEEVYGPEHPLTTGDIPVIGNEICRLRAEQGNAFSGSTYVAFALDYALGPSYSGGGGWSELGRFTIAPRTNNIDYAPLWSQLASVGIAEWTPERGVIRLSFTPGMPSTHLDVYLTLQRGWTAPRVEAYLTTASGGPALQNFFVWWQANDVSPQLAAVTRLDGGSTNVATTEVSSQDSGTLSNAAALMEPWVAVQSITLAKPAVLFIREADSTWNGVWMSATSSNLYGGTARPLVRVAWNQSSNGYYSCQLGISAPGAVSEAEAVRNTGSGTTAQVSDPGALTAPGTPNAPTTSASGGTLPASTTYAYKFAAYNATGITAGSAPSATVTTGTGSTNSNTVTWTAISGATGYLVYRQTGGSGNFYLIGSASGTTYTDTSTAQNTSVQPPTSDTSGQISSGGVFVTESQGAETNPTLSFASVPVTPGTYALFARIRGFTGDTMGLQWGGTSTSASSSPVTSSGGHASASVLNYQPASMAWTWVYVGEATVTAGGTLVIWTWVASRAAQNPAGSNAAIDAVGLIPTERQTGASPTFDGARDQAAQHLIDTRAFAEVVQR